MVKKLIFKTEIKDEEGKVVEIKEEDIIVKNDDGVDVHVQVKDFLSSEDYFKFLGLSPETRLTDKSELTNKTAVLSQPAQYHLILSTVINPKLTSEQVKAMNFKIQVKLFIALQQFYFFDEEEEENVFLGQGGQQGDSQPEPT